MNTQSLVSDVIILVLPLMLALAFWLFHWLEQRLPEKQRSALDYFVDIAVKNVEQELGTMPNAQKKEAAIKIVEQFFTFFKLPVPDMVLIDATVEACVYEINQATKVITSGGPA